jgi:hypothetical protein
MWESFEVLDGSPALDVGDEEFNRAGDGTRSTLSNETLQRTS